MRVRPSVRFLFYKKEKAFSRDLNALTFSIQLSLLLLCGKYMDFFLFCKLTFDYSAIQCQ